LAVHASTTGHAFNFNKTSIKGREEFELKRKVLEVIYILKDVHNVNFKINTAGFAGAYNIAT